MNQHWLDDALCDALVAARQGHYDGRDVEFHLETLIDRVREKYDTEHLAEDE